MSLESKKLVLVLAISMPVTETKEEVVEIAETGKTVKVFETSKAGKNGKES